MARDDSTAMEANLNLHLLAIAYIAPITTTPFALPTPSTLPIHSTSDNPPLNIILIVLDDVGTDQLSMYGAEGTQALTPNLDALAAAGIRFNDAYANPVCSPSRAEIMTGRYSFRTGLGYVTEGASSASGPWKLRDEEVFVSELLKITGVPGGPYACGAFGKWHLSGQTDWEHPINNGFDIFQGPWANVGVGADACANHFFWTRVTGPADCSTSPPPIPRFTGYNLTVDACSGAVTGCNSLNDCEYETGDWDAEVTRLDADAWIGTQTGPFFAYVAFNPPHQPWQFPPLDRLSSATSTELSNAGWCAGMFPSLDPNNAQADADRKLCYRAMLEAVDYEIGLLIQSLVENDKYDNTMIFVIGDNGTVGGSTSIIDGSLHDVTHGKKTVYQLGIHVPLIVAGPLVGASNATCDGFVSTVDLWRTLGRVAGLRSSQINSFVADSSQHPIPSRCLLNESCSSCPLVVDSLSFLNLIQNPAANSARFYAFGQLFEPNGEYLADTTLGPLQYHDQSAAYFCDTSCPTNCSSDAYSDLDKHLRSLVAGSGYKLVKKQTAPGAAGTPASPPQYTEEFYWLVGDPEESDSLIEATDPPLNPARQAILDDLRAQMTALSGK